MAGDYKYKQTTYNGETFNWRKSTSLHVWTEEETGFLSTDPGTLGQSSYQNISSKRAAGKVFNSAYVWKGQRATESLKYEYFSRDGLYWRKIKGLWVEGTRGDVYAKNKAWGWPDSPAHTALKEKEPPTNAGGCTVTIPSKAFDELLKTPYKDLAKLIPEASTSKENSNMSKTKSKNNKQSTDAVRAFRYTWRNVTKESRRHPHPTAVVARKTTIIKHDLDTDKILSYQVFDSEGVENEKSYYKLEFVGKDTLLVRCDLDIPTGTTLVILV